MEAARRRDTTDVTANFEVGEQSAFVQPSSTKRTSRMAKLVDRLRQATRN